MSYGPVSVFTVTMASAGTLTPQANLGRAWKRVYLDVPTMTSNTQIHIQGAAVTSGTFRRIQAVGSGVVSFVKTMGSMGTLTGAFDIGEGATNPYVLIPTLSTGTSILFHGSIDGSTFRKVTLPIQQTASVQAPSDFSIATFGADTARLVPLPEGFRYFKLEAATGVTDATTTYKVCAKNPFVHVDFKIASHLTNTVVPIPDGFQFIKIETTATVGDGAEFKIICSD